MLESLLWLPVYAAPAAVKTHWIYGENATGLFRWPQAVSNLRQLPWAWFKIFHMTAYAILIAIRFGSLSRSSPEVQTWFRWLNGLFAGFILSYASYFILVRFDFFNNSWDYMISFSMMFFIYFIAWFGYLQPKVFSGFTLAESITETPRYRNSQLSPDTSREILATVERLMKEKKLYRENDLRLETLAAAAGTSRHHLSQVINEQTGLSFFEYINSLRIREATLLLSSTSKSEMNVIEVAWAVGFNNKVTFNSTFKKMTGLTPTAYRARVNVENAPTTAASGGEIV